MEDEEFVFERGDEGFFFVANWEINATYRGNQGAAAVGPSTALWLPVVSP